MSLGERRNGHPGALASLKLVRIGEPIPKSSLQTFAETLVDSFLHLIRNVTFVQYDPPPFEAIEARLLTHALDEEVGGHILGDQATELISEGENGHVAASADVAAIAAAVVQTLVEGSELRERTAAWFRREAPRLRVESSVRRVVERYGA